MEAKNTLQPSGGIKFDAGKVSYVHLLKDLPRASESVTKVLMYGAKKYGRENYHKVEKERYEDAMLRHLMSTFTGEHFDPETDEPHLSHLVCSALFLIERILKEKEEQNAKQN